MWKHKIESGYWDRRAMEERREAASRMLGIWNTKEQENHL